MIPPAASELPPPPRGRRGWPWKARPSPPLRGADWPSVGIVTPSFNQGAYIERTIRSVLLQGYPRLEFFIMDGGSTDASVDVIRRHERHLSGWVSEPDKGQSDAINKGMARLAHAEWVTWLNSDDILLPGALRRIGEAARRSDAVAIIGSGVHRMGVRGRRIPAPPSPGLDATTVRNWRRASFLQPACFFRKDAFDAVGGVDASLQYAMDFDLWVKLGERGRFEVIDAVIAEDLQHPDAKTQKAMAEYYAEAVGVLFRRGHGEEARRMVADIYAEYAYLQRLVAPITRNVLYERLVRPIVRRFLAPPHVRRRDG